MNKKIMWTKNKFPNQILIIAFIALIPYPFIILKIWEIFQDRDLVAIVSSYLIIPAFFFIIFFESPKMIGFSKEGIHGKYFLKPKIIKHNGHYEKDIIDRFKLVRWFEINKIYIETGSKQANKNFPLFIRIYIHTKLDQMVFVQYTTVGLLLEIINQFETYKKLKGSYDLSKNRVIIKNLNEIESIHIG